MKSIRKPLGIAASVAIAGWLTLAGPSFGDLPPGPPPAHAQGKPPEAAKPADKGKPEDKGKGAASGTPAASAAASASANASGTPAASAAATATAAAAGDPPGKDPEKVKAERKDRAKKDRDDLKKKVQEKLKNQPMAQALKQELERHARRVARIMRVKEVAAAEKDDDSVQRADKLLTKENARHDKWMANYDAKGDAKGGGK